MRYERQQAHRTKKLAPISAAAVSDSFEVFCGNDRLGQKRFANSKNEEADQVLPKAWPAYSTIPGLMPGALF
jgi:hypothetical protein